MQNDNEHGNLSDLLDKYLNNNCTQEELEDFLKIAAEPSEDLIQLLKEKWSKSKGNGILDLGDWEQRFESMMIEARMMKMMEKEGMEANFHKSKRGGVRRILQWSAAAAVLGGILLITFFVLKQKDTEVLKHPGNLADNEKILPGGDKAILTLADGTQIALDTAANGSLAEQGGTKIIKIGGQLNYDVASSGSQVLYNTITTPKGGQYQLELSDGSKVWLNAASSLRFPTAFAGKERMVELSGEGYFEVVKDSRKSFIVNISNQSKVEVLGTHFNVNAYEDEPAVKITLLEGLVSVSGGVEKALLKPGQQAQVKNTIKVVDGIDPDEVMAWKQGIFVFENARIEEVMKTLSRWYDFDVKYAKGIPQTRFGGKIPRDTDIRDVLKILQESGINCNINNRQITITP